MSTHDATLPFGQQSQPEAAQDQQQNTGKSNTAAAAVATGAAAAAAGAAGYYAYTQMADDAEVVDAIVVDDSDEDVDTEIVSTGDPGLNISVNADINTGHTDRTATGHGTGTHGTGSTTQPVTGTDPSTGTGSVQGTVPGTGTQQTTTPGTGTQQTTTPGTGTGTATDPGTHTDPATGGTTVQDPPVPADPVVNPQIDVHENPDEIADALIAVDEVDPDDIDGAAPFTFTDVDTVYDIYGNATTQAHYYGDDGTTGVMIDLDGDGVFDHLTDDATGTMYVVNDDNFLTVGDAQLDADSGYIAYNEDQDTMIDDDPMDDIIDSDDFA